jgi:hypothetical protein
MGDRCTDAELRERELAALELLASGAGSAFSAQTLADRYGCSLRQARRYVALASFELCSDVTPAELDRQAALGLYQLDRIAGKAALAGDDALAIRAGKAHLQAVAQLRRAIVAPHVRFRLRDNRAPPDATSEPPF